MTHRHKDEVRGETRRDFFKKTTQAAVAVTGTGLLAPAAYGQGGPAKVAIVTDPDDDLACRSASPPNTGPSTWGCPIIRPPSAGSSGPGRPRDPARASNDSGVLPVTATPTICEKIATTACCTAPGRALSGCSCGGDPALAAGYGRYAHFCGSLGLERCEPLSFKGRMGSGTTTNRNAYADASLEPAGGDWRKHLCTYRLRGRLLYNPDAPRPTWERFLATEFGPAARSCEAALANASRVLPLITTAHDPSASNI